MRVLLIEDDRALARSIELMLKAAGFNVYMTDLGEDGVAVISYTDGKSRSGEVRQVRARMVVGADGALQVHTATGLRTVHSAEVSVRPVAGEGAR